MFCHFPETTEYFPFRQGFQEIKIAENKLRLVKHPHHVFIPVKIYAVFASNAGIYLGEEGGGDKTELQSAQKGGCRKTRYIADNPSPDPDDER